MRRLWRRAGQPAIAGASARSLSFKRFSFQQGTDKAVALPTARTVEESLSEVVAEAGSGPEAVEKVELTPARSDAYPERPCQPFLVDGAQAVPQRICSPRWAERRQTYFPAQQ